jgi:hypothetical protein
MKKRLLTLVILLAAYSGIFGQYESMTTFETMGYRDQNITGIAGALTYFARVKPDDDIDQSRLVLYIRPSQILNPNTSHVTVYLKDEAVYTQRLAGVGIDSIFAINIPLEKRYLQEDGRFVKVRVAAKMSISDEYCKDLENPAVWMSVRNNSYVYTVKRSSLTYQRSLKETLQEFKKVYSPVTSDLDDVMAGGIAYAILKQSITSNITEIESDAYQPGDSISRSVVVGVINKLPEYIRNQIPAMGKGQGMIVLVNNEAWEKHVLVITGADAEGYKKAIRVLSNNRIMSSAFSEKLLVDNALNRITERNSLPVVLSLEQLGAQTAIMEGVGALKTNYAFSLADYNAIPEKLTFHLDAVFSMIKETDRGFLNVYLNDNLVYSTTLSDKRSFSEDIELKPYLLTKNNGLTVEMRFHPGGNICKEGFANFFGFVNPKTSTITFSGERRNEFSNFFNYPGEFRKSPLKFLITPALYPSVISSVGELIFQINATTTPSPNMILPVLDASDKAQMSDMRGYNVIALLQRTDGFLKNFQSLPVNFTKDFQLYKDLEGQVSYSINDFSNSGIAQIFRQSGSTFLLISTLGDTAVRGAFESVIKSFGTQFSSIESNVCIATSKGQSNFFFKLPEDSDLVTYRGDRNPLLIFWETYKYFIVGVLVVFLILAYFFVKKRVKKSQEIV